ncbi:MAG: CorA family divalent cation transporter, partial [Desulfonatronovibrio sp.]
LSGMLDLYVSSVSQRLNEIMKVLTIFASVFMPLTFLAGVYGMNFEYMPELSWKIGYFLCLGLMAAIGLGLAGFFKYKNWF